MIHLLLYGASQMIYSDETYEAFTATDVWKESGGTFFHQNKDEIDTIVGTTLFVLVGAATIATVGTAGAASPVLGVLEGIDLAYTVAYYAAEAVDRNIDWTNPLNTPQYVLDISSARDELLLIEGTRNLTQLSIALGYSNPGEMDLSNEDSLNEVATQLAPIELSTGLELDEIIQLTNYISQANDALTFIHRKKREIIQRNLIIFNGMTKIYRNSTYTSQRTILLSYLLKKIHLVNGNKIVIDKTMDEIYKDGTFTSLTEYMRCFLKNKGQKDPNDFSDPYMRAFIKYEKPGNLYPLPFVDKIIATLKGVEISELTSSETDYYKFIILITIIIIVIFISLIVIYMVINMVINYEDTSYLSIPLAGKTDPSNNTLNLI